MCAVSRPNDSSTSEVPDASAECFRRTRQHHAEETAQDYVELIAQLQREQGEARLVEIARRLGVSHVTANQTIRRLQRDGYVTKQPYRAVFLTDAGRALAERTRVRHEVVVRFLQTIGVPAEQAGIDAEGIEHHISDVTLQAMERFLTGGQRDNDQ